MTTVASYDVSTSAPNPADDDRLVASSFQQFFDRLLSNTSLSTDDEFRLFLESDFGYTPTAKNKKRVTSGSGWLTTKSGATNVRTLPSTSAQIGGPPETIVSVLEEDELSSAKLQFRLLEERLVESCRAVDQLSRAKRNFSHGLGDLSSRLVQFSTTESHGALAEGFKKLAHTIRMISEIETNSSVGYLVTLSDGLSWCSVSSKAAKEVLKNRTGVLQEHYASVKKSIEKRRTIERIKSNTSTASSERVEAAMEELEEAKNVEETIAQKAMLISTNLRPSLRTHSKQLHDDLLYSLIENARTQLIYEKQMLKELERLKPELQSISLRTTNVIYRTYDSKQSPQHQQEGNGKEISPIEERMINDHRRTSIATNSGSIRRVNEIAKNVIGRSKDGENLDSRQKVDAKTAAASLARLF